VIQRAADVDWYRVPQPIWAELYRRGEPGVRVKRGTFQVHQTHLPLIEELDAARFCTPSTIDVAAREALDVKTEQLGFKLRPYQHDGREFILPRRGTLVADEPRVGKTVQSLMAHDPVLGRLVVIAPLMVRETWLGWIRRVFPGEDIGVMAGKSFDRAEASKPIVFGHYNVIKAWASDTPIGTLIFDEIHELSNPRSRRTEGAAMLASRAERLIGLTGTPIWNRPIGMWSILALLAPGAFGDRHTYGLRYCDGQPGAHGWTYTGATNSDELDRRLSQIKIRRRHKDVQANLPPISRDVIVAEVSDAARRKLDFAADALRKSDVTNTAGLLARYRAVLAQVKIDVTVDYCQRVVNNDEPLVVWTWHKSAANKIHERLTEEGVCSFLCHGDITPAKRESAMAQWKLSLNGVLVITIPTDMVGIDLSHAMRALFVEIDYTPALMEQAEKRTYTPFRPSYITYVVADHLIDRRMVEALSGKLTSSRPLGLTAAEDAIDLLHELFTGAANDNVFDPARLMAGLLEIDEAA
jgi:SWI/SNF-related matrix-associated actin-dependent regulator 1 of chromatin subfamily A